MAVLILPAVAEAKSGDRCQSKACEERVARKACAHGDVVACIRRAALHRHQSFRAMLRVARCESGLNPLAYFPGQIAETVAEQRFALANDRSSGLFAFKPGTWRGTPYAARSPFFAKWSALAAGWLMQRSGLGPWLASRHCWA